MEREMGNFKSTIGSAWLATNVILAKLITTSTGC